MEFFGEDKPVPTANGIPLQRVIPIVGAIGVSGGTVPQDIEVAEAGVEAFKNNE